MSRRPPLWGLLRMRRARRQQARGELGQAQVSEKVARTRLAELRAAQDRSRLDPALVLRPAQLRALHLQGIRSGELLDEAARLHVAATERLDAATDGWKKATAEADAAETLAARRRERTARDARVAAERALDDLNGMLRHREQS